MKIDNNLLKRFVPITLEEIEAQGWMKNGMPDLDILLITGDAYVDHPSFGIALLGRLLMSKGYKVAIISQPLFPGFQGPKGLDGVKESRSPVTEEEAVKDFQRFGAPKLFVGIGSGVVDSMINNYTANKKPRSDDQYAENAKGGMRPDYASAVYSQISKKAFPNTPVLVGGVEASLRRLAHFDYWQNRVRPSYLVDMDADFIVYGMAEQQILRAAEVLAESNGENTGKAFSILKRERGFAFVEDKDFVKNLENYKNIPSFDEVKEDKKKFAKATLFAEIEAVNPYAAKTLVQYHGNKAVVVNPPALPLEEKALDAIYDLPFTKKKHFSYKGKIPAAEMIQFSITVTRGCFGSCTFCGLSLHQGKVVQSRSEKSIMHEIERATKHEDFHGIITDLGGPTANSYKMHCMDETMKKTCQRISCLHPSVCGNMKKDHSEQIALLQKASKITGVRKVFIASGVRHDLAIYDKAYIKELVSHHVGGHLKLAPEHTDEKVLSLMKKPSFKVFEEFMSEFEKISKEVHKTQYIVPYFISNFPGCTQKQMEKVNYWLQEKNWNLQQVQSFIPLPMTLASAMYYAGIDPETKEELYVSKDKHDKKKQQILLQPHRADRTFTKKRK